MCSYTADADANPIISLKRKYTALNQAYTNQGRELALLQSQVGPGSSNDAPEPHLQGEGQAFSIAPAPGNILDNKQLSVSTRGVYRNELPEHHRVSRRREVDPIRQATDILHALTLASDQDSIVLLARLRLGESWNSVADSLPAYQSLSEMNNRINTYTTPGALPLNAEPSDVYSATDREAASKSLKPWLIKLFDRQYFRQMFAVHHSSRSHILPSEPGSPAYFGNMPFSSAIGANHHPELVQDTQQHNYRVPTWARRVLNATTLEADPFQSIMTDLQNDIAGGIAVEDLCGPHPYVGALDDENTFHRAPKLSQIVARMVVSLKPAESKTTFTQYAMMYKYWALWRWLIHPTVETYAAMPEFVRPIASQFFVAHPHVFDFVITGGLRDLLIRHDDPDITWFTEAAVTIRCTWHGSSEAALCRNAFTNEIDFNPMYKVS